MFWRMGARQAEVPALSENSRKPSRHIPESPSRVSRTRRAARTSLDDIERAGALQASRPSGGGEARSQTHRDPTTAGRESLQSFIAVDHAHLHRSPERNRIFDDRLLPASVPAAGRALRPSTRPRSGRRAASPSLRCQSATGTSPALRLGQP